jgi:hypothetical protein
MVPMAHRRGAEGDYAVNKVFQHFQPPQPPNEFGV